MSIRTLQLKLEAAGFDVGPVDGEWGPRTEAALDLALSYAPKPKASLAWGEKVSPTFRAIVFAMSVRLGIDPDHLMACMAWESGETFRADVRNLSGSGATGLIQFMPATARGLDTTTDALAAMTPEFQLSYVESYFKPYRGRLRTLGDLYMAILWPAGIGKPESWALWTRTGRPTTYRQNAGIDSNRDGVITKAEATSKVQGKLEKGMLPGFRWSE